MGLQREERGFGRRNISLHARSQEKKEQFLLLLPNPASDSARSTSSAQARQPCGFTGEGSPAAAPALLLLPSQNLLPVRDPCCHHQIPLPVPDPCCHHNSSAITDPFAITRSLCHHPAAITRSLCHHLPSPAGCHHTPAITKWWHCHCPHLCHAQRSTWTSSPAQSSHSHSPRDQLSTHCHGGKKRISGGK